MTEYVSVGCKLPNGIYIQPYELYTTDEVLMGAPPRQIQLARSVGDPIKIQGTNPDTSTSPPPVLINGFRFTENVPLDVWENWLHFNKTGNLVKNGLLFAHKNRASAVAEAREKEGVRTGFEPMNREGDHRARGIKPDDRRVV